MAEVSIIGLDLAKNVFQAHGAAADGSVVFRRKLSRLQVLKFFAGVPRCTVAMEACASAHHWARAIAALGHAVKLIPPVYVKPFVKRQKNDMADAEAAGRPTMRFVAVKSEEQQAMAQWPVAAAVGAGEEPCLPSERDAAQSAFGCVVAEADATVAEEPGEACPAPEHVVDGLGHGRVARQGRAFGAQRHARRPEFHAGTCRRVKHPRRDHREDARQDLDMHEMPRPALVDALDPQTPAEKRMPAVVNHNNLPDMGRMNGRWP